MRGVNKSIIIGPVTSQINFKKTPDGISICKFRITTSHKRSDGSNKLEHHNIETWDKLADMCNKNLSPGRIVYIEGRNETEIWGEDDNKKYKTKIVVNILEFLDDKPEKIIKKRLKEQFIKQDDGNGNTILIEVLDKITF